MTIAAETVVGIAALMVVMKGNEWHTSPRGC